MNLELKKNKYPYSLLSVCAQGHGLGGTKVLIGKNRDSRRRALLSDV